jgi:RimJ/RimL family protein N-acetyltransferase
MKNMQSNRPDIQLLVPDAERDASFALSWFERPEGHATLLSMGNAEDEIEPSTLEGEKATLREFLDLEKDNKQMTRMIVVDGKTIGAVWIELFENHGVKPPSIHIMIGNPEYRGKGIGASVMQSAVDYVKDVLHAPAIYTRHLASNTIVSNMNKGLGFVEDGEPYADENGLTWQPIKLELSLG